MYRWGKTGWKTAWTKRSGSKNTGVEPPGSRFRNKGGTRQERKETQNGGARTHRGGEIRGLWFQPASGKTKEEIGNFREKPNKDEKPVVRFEEKKNGAPPHRQEKN